MIYSFLDKVSHVVLPEVFPNPFNDDPPELARLAGLHLQNKLKQYHDQPAGMIGVLVIKDLNSKFSYIASYSDELVYDSENIQFISVPGLEDEKLSICNPEGVHRPIKSFFDKTHLIKGIGKCATSRLLNYANLHKLTPVAVTEFWWGAASSNEVRHHGQFYPSSRGKCLPLFSFLMGEKTFSPFIVPGLKDFKEGRLDILYEDDFLVAVNKPAGMLSVPGKQVKDSVITRLKQERAELEFLTLLHRLDMMTSGILIAAKDAESHKKVQKQFMDRDVGKRYVAVLEKPWTEWDHEVSGEINLPLRVDLEDRPRQLICHRFGKNAISRWEKIENISLAGKSRASVNFFPKTGRTHQLRVHAAHSSGLDNPILGDTLYGQKSDRLYLHADKLVFRHPADGRQIEISSAAPF